MHRSLILPSRSKSSARAFSTPVRTSAVLLTGYSLFVLSSSSFRHSQVEHVIVELSAVAAISNPSMLMMCQKACQSLTVSWDFAQLVDLSDDGIHTPMIQL